MSTSVDERVVQMKFDNKNFEKNVQESIYSLEKLKGSLDFDKSEKSVASLQKSFNAFDSTSLATDISKIASRFSALGIMGDQVLRRLADGFINAGLKAKGFIDSITVDQVSAGWDKYINKTTSIQTIMNATGASVEEVNDVLEQLQWFSDETSFSFTDMAAALGQMTSAGGDMKKLVPMIMGIANATAFAGKGPAEFSRAIYNLNQSYGTGSLKYMDWKSLEMAGVNSKQLKQTLIDTAVELGRIEEGQVDLSNFNESLKDDWADQSVMERAFGRFAEVTQKAYEMVNAGTFDTASDAYDALAGKYDEIYYRAARAAQEAKTFQEAIDATKDAVSSGWMKSFELIFGNYFEAKDLWTSVANSFWDIFAQSAESRNELLEEWHNLTVGGYADFAEAISTLLDGIYQAKNALSDIVYSILPDIDTPHLAKAVTSFKSFSENFRVFFTGVNPVDLDISSIMEENGLATRHETLEFINRNAALKEAFERQSAFDAIIEKGNRFKEGFAGIVSVVNSLRKVLVTVWNTFSPLFKIFGGISSFLNDIFASFGRVAQYIDQFIHSGNGLRKTVDSFATTVSNKFEKAGNAVYSFFEKTIKWDEEKQRFVLTGEAIDKVRQKWEELKQSQVGTNFTKLYDSIKPVFGFIEKALGWIGQQIVKLIPHAINGLATIVEWLSVVAGWLADIFNSIRNWFNNNEWFSQIRDWFKSLKVEDVKNAVGGLFDFIKSALKDVEPYFQPVIDKLKEIWDLITAGNFEGFKNLMAGLLEGGGLLALFKLSKSGGNFFDQASEIGETINGFLGKFTGQQDTGRTIVTIAFGIGLLALSLSKLASLDTDQIVNATAAMGAMLFMLSSFLKVLNKMAGSDIFKPVSPETATKNGILTKIFGNNAFLFKSETPLQKATKALVSLGHAMLLFGLAIKLISKIDADGLGNALLVITGIMMAFVIFTQAMTSIQNTAKNVNSSFGKFGNGILKIGTGLVLMASSLIILAGAIALFSLFKPDQLAKAGDILFVFVLAVSSLAVIGTQFAVGIEAFGWAMIKGAAALDIAIPAFLALGLVLSQLSKLNPDGLLAAVLSLSIVLGALALSLSRMDIWGAGALAAAAVGILLLVNAIKALSGIELKNSWQGFVALAAGIGLLVAGCWALNKVKAPELFEKLTKSFANVAKATLMFTGALLVLKIIGPESIKTLLDGIASLGPSIYGAVTTIVDSVLTAILVSTPKILLTLGEMILMLGAFLRENGLPIMEAVVGLVGDMILAIDHAVGGEGGLIDRLIELVIHTIEALAESLSEHSGDLATAITKLFDSVVAVIFDLLAGLAERIPVVGGTIAKALRDLKNFLLTGEGVLSSAEVKYTTAAGQIQNGIGNNAENFQTILKGLQSDNAEERKAAVEAYRTLEAAAGRFKEIQAAGQAGVNNMPIGDRTYGQFVLNTDFSELYDFLANPTTGVAIKNAEAAMIEDAKNTAEEGAEQVTDTAKEGAKKLNLETAKAFLSSHGIALSAIDSGSFKKIQTMLANGVKEEDVAKLISGNVTDGFALDNGKLEAFAADGSFSWLKGLISNEDSAVTTAAEYVESVEKEFGSNSDEFYADGYEKGNYYTAGLINGLQKQRIRLGIVASEVGDIIKNRTRATLQVQSPSKVAEEIGGFWDLGLINGLKKYTDRVASASTATANSIINSFSDAATTASSLMSGDLSNSLTATPIMDLNNRRAITHLSSVMEDQNRRAQFMDPRKVAERPGFRGSGPVTTNNYGGFNISVNADTDDPRALAKEIMEEIQIEIERKEAALA